MKKCRRIIRNMGIVAGAALAAAAIFLAAYNPVDLLLNPPVTDLPDNKTILVNVDDICGVPVAVFRFSDGKMEAVIHAYFDTGSAINTINERTLQLIKGQGYVKKEYFCPLLVTDANKRTRFQTRCVHIDIPVMFTQDLRLNHCIKNVRFFVVPNDELMTLGAEFMKEFVIHSEFGGRQWRLNHQPPEKYVAEFSLKRFNWHLNDLGGRYYWPLKAGDVEENFFIDTGYGFAPLQMPAEEYKGCNPAQVDTSYSSNSAILIKNTFDTLAVKAGDITFNTEVCFTDGMRNTYYVVNPHALKEKFNISYDLKNRKIYLVKRLE